MSSVRQTIKAKRRFCGRCTCSFHFTWYCRRRRPITFIMELLKQHVRHTGYVYISTFLCNVLVPRLQYRRWPSARICPWTVW